MTQRFRGCLVSTTRGCLVSTTFFSSESIKASCSTSTSDDQNATIKISETEVTPPELIGFLLVSVESMGLLTEI